MYKQGNTYNLFLTDSQKITTEMEGNRVACTQYDIKNNKVIHGTIEISTEKKEKEVYKTKEKKETGIRTVKRTVIPENSEKWKPNALFFSGSGLCILITILYEILI